MRTKTCIYPTSESTAAGLAEYFEKWVSQKQPFTVALSGGSTPRLLFRHLARHYRERIDWSGIHFFWGDERCVPPDHPDSNYLMTADSLLRHIEIPAENVHRIRGEAEPQAEAARYGTEIRKFVAEMDGLPVFDLIILGLGEDGHTASIFPDQMDLMDTNDICAVATHPDSGQKRITLTGKVISGAEKVAFLVTGSAKRSVVQSIREQSGNWKHYPASYIRSRHTLFWFLDEAADGKNMAG